MESVSGQDIESGYVSGSGSEASLPELYFTKSHLHFLNRQLQNLEPQGEIASKIVTVRWFLIHRIHRNTTMVHHNSSLALPDNRLRSYRSCYSRYAVEDEDSKAANGRPDLS